MNYSRELLDEISEVIDVTKEIRHTRVVPVIYDGSQYTLKIPKELAEQAGISSLDQFMVKASTRLNKEGKQGTLSGHLIRHASTDSAQE
ncbi:MAG: hypothetical protein R6V53_01420 [Candidatus Woesearchaeota archaeon]